MSVELQHYMHDGANWQAQAVMVILKGREIEIVSDYGYNTLWEHNARIDVGRYENTREQGYVFTLLLNNNQLKHYAVYEHRNSDDIHILTNTGICLNTPSVDFMWRNRKEDKYATDAHFECGSVEKAAQWILDDMEMVLEENAKDKE